MGRNRFSDKKQSSLRIPRESRKAYHETLGQLLAKEKILEIKSAQYGKLVSIDRYNTTTRLPAREGFNILKRDDIYRKAMHLFGQNELIRPIINLIASSVFSSGQPDIKGKDEKLVKLAQDIISENDLNFHELAREGELAGDVFLVFDKPNKERTKILSLDAGRVNSVLKDNDIRQLLGYEIYSSGKVDVTPDRCQHLKINSTTTSRYGQSSLRHIIYWTDVLDFLFESKWLRGADNYGQPLLAVTGVPSQFQAAVKATLEQEVQRSGKVWVLPPETDVKSPDLSLDYPIGNIVDWVFRMISIATEIPITLLGSADASSRGSAFFANPRFVLAIKPRREVWRIGLRRFFLKLFKKEGIISEEEVVSRRDFDIGFLPIFDRDLTDIADVVAIYRDRKLISKESAQEMIGLDASEEAIKLDDEPEEEPIPNLSTDPVAMAKARAMGGLVVGKKKIKSNGSSGDDD